MQITLVIGTDLVDACSFLVTPEALEGPFVGGLDMFRHPVPFDLLVAEGALHHVGVVHRLDVFGHRSFVNLPVAERTGSGATTLTSTATAR